MNELFERISALRQGIEAARARSPHAAPAVTIVAVTKYHPVERVDEVVEAGILDVGESRVQEALEKAGQSRTRPRWHLIGHLQRNKARRAAELFDVIHSVDSPRLVEALDRAGRPMDIFLQVNVSGEESKTGVSLEALPALLRAAYQAPNLRPLGLMTMAPYDDDPERARPFFRTLRQLQEERNEAGDGPPLEALSMGMSGDHLVAVEEGATHVRIGTALVGKRSPTTG